mmetsp:Transcript_15003/g.40304  ORF Transcript_15003/g.40304 Transcript_15003/m.40304 type:complete len:326 (-) Transcript_15003:15-992(-)
MTCVACCHEYPYNGDDDEIQDDKFGGLKSDAISLGWKETIIKVAEQRQIDAHLFRPGQPCLSCHPAIGDRVLSTGGSKLGRNAAGEEFRWCLRPGEYATVVEVDEDFDFRLRNSDGVESGFLLRCEFVYAERTPQEEGGERPEDFEVSVSGRFCVPLTRLPGGRFGLHLDIASDGSGEVLGICEGSIQGYNESAPRDRQVVPGCFVLPADDAVRCKDAMVEDLTSKLELRLLVAPRATFVVDIDKASPSGLGLDLECGQHSKTLTVKGVREGGAADHNSQAKDLYMVKVGDRIEAVNGVRGDAGLLLAQLRCSSAVSLVIARPGI